MSKWRIFIVSLALLTLLVTLMSGCDNKEEYSLTVTADPSGGGTISPAVGTYAYDDGTEVEVTATAADGYVFDHWSGDVSGDTNPITITMISDETVVANFAIAYDLTVDVEAVGAGEVTLSEEGPYKEDSEITLTAAPADGYVFDHWSGDVSEDTNPITITMTSDKTVTANFDPAYDLVVDVEPVGAGEVTLSEEGPYKEDTEVMLTAEPADGYVFDNWSGDTEETTLSVSITMTSDKTVTANFAAIYNLTVNIPNDLEGEVTLSEEGPYTEGTEVMLTAEPSDGYFFDHWSGDVSDDTNPITITMDSNKTVDAHFSHIMYSLTVEVFPDDKGNVVEISSLLDSHETSTSLTLSYASFTEVTLTVEFSKSTYLLTGWRDMIEDKFIGDENPFTLIMDSDKEIRAVIFCGG